jgi:thiaminase/transcriptional activator TenA
MRFSERLYEAARPIWEKNHAHPFVQGIGNGLLPLDKFCFYMRQDYVYLIDYARMFAIGSVKAEDLETMGKFAELLASTLHVEMELHRQYAAKFGISRDTLESTEPSPVTMAYTNYMHRVAQNGTLAELVSVVLPCTWSYWEIGKRLKSRGLPEAQPLYHEWIEMYASEEFGDLAKWLIDLIDHLAEGLPERHLSGLTKHFVIASRYEYLFWDMAYNRTMWSVE